MFPNLVAINQEIGFTVREMYERRWHLNFRRWLDPILQMELNALHDRLWGVALNEEPDRPKWKWTKSGIYFVKSLYENLAWGGKDRSFRHLWKAKIPLKIRVWLWLIWHNAIATKDNMTKRNWVGDTICRFCSDPETIHHLFFGCGGGKYTWGIVSMTIGAQTRPTNFSQYFWWITQHIPISRNLQIVGMAAICWALWKLRNRACFEQKLI